VSRASASLTVVDLLGFFTVKDESLGGELLEKEIVVGIVKVYGA